MLIKKGFFYHIKDEFFQRIHDEKLLQNKGNNRRPHFYAMEDAKNPEIFWMVPVSSKVEKYSNLIERSIERYGKCNTIRIGYVSGRKAAFLVQDAFPIISKYIDYIHMFKGKPAKINYNLNVQLEKNLIYALNLYSHDTKIIHTDIKHIYTEMEKELEKDKWIEAKKNKPPEIEPKDATAAPDQPKPKEPEKDIWLRATLARSVGFEIKKNEKPKDKDRQYHLLIKMQHRAILRPL